MGQRTVLALAARTASLNSADIQRTTEKGIQVITNITIAPGGDTLTIKVQGKDNLGNYYDILANAATAATGITTLTICPGMNFVANVSNGNFVPDIYRVVVTASAGTSFTYSVCINDVTF